MIRLEDRQVLVDLATTARELGREFYVIGAGARLLVHDWPHDVEGGRETTDWDIAVCVPGWRDYESLKAHLTDGEPPAFSPAAAEHRLIHRSGRRLDLVPFGGVEDEERRITYPRDGTRHSTYGLRECRRHCTQVTIASGVEVSVVTTPALVVLKAEAFLDRRIEGATHDLQDIDFLLRTYAATVPEKEVFDRAGDALVDDRIEYEDVGAFLLGQRLAEEMEAETLRPVHQVLLETDDEGAAVLDPLVRHALFEEEQIRERRAVLRRFAALKAGLESVPTPG